MQMMPANSALQATMVTEVADSIFFWANVTNITFSIVQHADLALHHHTLPAVCAAVSPALVLPTITPGLDMHSMITHQGEHDDGLLGKGMSEQHTMLGFAEVIPVTLFIRNTALAACYQLQLVCCFMPDSSCSAMMC